MRFTDVKQNSILRLCSTIALWISLQFIWKLFENAVLTWIDNKIADNLGITNPTLQQVTNFIIMWGSGAYYFTQSRGKGH